MDAAVKTTTDMHEVLNRYSGKPMTKLIRRRLDQSLSTFRNTSGQYSK